MQLRLSIVLLVVVLVLLVSSIASTTLHWDADKSLVQSESTLEDVVQLPCYVLRKVGSGESAIYQMVYRSGCKSSGGSGTTNW